RKVGQAVKECLYRASAAACSRVAFRPWAQLCCPIQIVDLARAGSPLFPLVRRGTSKESQHAVSKRRGKGEVKQCDLEHHLSCSSFSYRSSVPGRGPRPVSCPAEQD